MSFWKRLLGKGKKRGDTTARKAPASAAKPDTKKRETKKRETRKRDTAAYPLANVGSLLKRAKADPDKMIADCTKALKVNPKFEQARKALAELR